ncbi:secreted frizzled-related protein 2-like [Danio aesculapii]|uniref:secreted frizzled-related protein 2-like n=1 Tax=Danio aesculapii TaxID=1142201 RepID=UPI0024C077D8|nr:secreted frizzled-related protein 2-like [Danio aesculapii]
MLYPHFLLVCVFVCVFLRSSSADDEHDIPGADLSALPVSDFIASAEFGSARSVCKPVPNTMVLCAGIGYRDMRLPNLLEHQSAREAQQQSAAWVPLLGKRCHRDTRHFLCSLFAPVCLPEVPAPVSPCRSLCVAVRDACAPVMSAFGFPWPEMFNCSRFTDGPELCIPGERDPLRAPTTGAPTGSAICEACSADGDGEREILQEFCTAQFVVRMRVGSCSVIGSDLRVVPEGRSRVLRQQDPQAALELRVLWLPQALHCSCPALDGPLTGTYIILGHTHSGRMQIHRLLRWTRDEKTLKKLIRTLLKRQC